MKIEKKAISIMIDYLESLHEYNMALQFRDWESADNWLIQSQLDLKTMKDFVAGYIKENKKGFERVLFDDDEH